MTKKTEFVKFHTIKEYIGDILKMRSSKSAVEEAQQGVDAVIETILKQAVELAKKDRRQTVMDQDISSALEKNLSKELTWQETAQAIINRNPADLGKISKAINEYIEKEQQ